MFSHVKSGYAILLHAFLLALFLFLAGNHANAEVAGAKSATGVSVNNRKVVIDGVDVPFGTEYYKSTVTGDEYRISYHASSVTVVSQGKKAPQVWTSPIKIEATASDGGVANAGRVVIVR